MKPPMSNIVEQCNTAYMSSVREVTGPETSACGSALPRRSRRLQLGRIPLSGLTDRRIPVLDRVPEQLRRG
jgi:hypothetical protein